MKAIKNIDTHELQIPYNFRTYVFPVDLLVVVEDTLQDFLIDRFPLSFAFSQKKEEDTPMVQSYKTKVFIPTKEEANELGNQFMRINSTEVEATFSTPDGVPPSGATDKDGISWYGEGIEQEGA